MTTPIIKLNQVSKTYHLGEDVVKAVDQVSLNIYKKEYISILGSSGSGKSTLMYLIGLLETPTSGQIILNNKNISKLNDNQVSKIRNEAIGFVFQANEPASRSSDCGASPGSPGGSCEGSA